jgi:hypothetical protein
MKILFNLLLIMLFLVKSITAQKYAPTHFINWLVAEKKISGVCLLQQADAASIFILKNPEQYQFSAADSNMILQQLKHPFGKLNASKIPGAIIISSANRSGEQKGKFAKQYDSLNYTKLFHPVFLSNNRVWIKIEKITNGSGGNGFVFIYEKKGKAYNLILIHSLRKIG